MSLEDITRLMEIKKQEAIREREQKQLAELRPPLQPSLAENAAVPTAQQFGPASRQLPLAASPQGEAETGRPQPVAGPHPTPSLPIATTTAGKNDMPFWNGAGVQNSNPPPNQSAADMGFPAWARDANLQASLQPQTAPQSPWWGDDPPQPEVALHHQAAAASRFPAEGTAAPPISSPAANSAAGLVRRNTSPFVRQQAYQLGMSVGPGTMFPVVPPMGGNSASPPSPSETNAAPWSSSTAPGGYLEMKPAVAEAPAASWQTAPTQAAPPSPPANWNSPSFAPWPSADQARTSPSEKQPLPLITPGISPWQDRPSRGTAASPPADSASDAEGDGTGVVPAWFHAPPATRSNTAAPRSTTIPQWPYAPR